MPLPTPVRFANFRGDASDSIGNLVGPNRLGELLTVVSAEFDAEANMTRVGYAFGVHEARS
jgi:hypothetical protein